MTFRHQKRLCDECPWRRDVPAGRFTKERFAELRSTVMQDFSPIFACHKSVEGKDVACAGYLLRDGINNFTVRLAIVHDEIDLPEIRRYAAMIPLYEDYAQMERANIRASDHKKRLTKSAQGET